MLTPAIKNRLFYTGLVLIALAAIVLVSDLTGLLALPESFLGGETTLHSLARVAVIGCVLAAVGSWEQTSSKEQKEQHHDATI